MSNTKESVTYTVCLNREFIHHADSSHKTYSQAKQAIKDKIDYYTNIQDMSLDNKNYWLGKYMNAFIVEHISNYTVLE